MGVCSNRAEAELNVQTVKRVPRELLNDTTGDSLIRRARNGEDVHADNSGQQTNWNLWVKGKRIWLNDLRGGDAA